LLLSPICPFIGEELWQTVLGHGDSPLTARWPAHDPAALQRDEVEVAVQINGVVRERLTVSSEVAGDRAALEAAALGLAGVQRRLAGASPQKVIVVPGRLVNLVV
jgi:leucyl-tRNA synthetase